MSNLILPKKYAAYKNPVTYWYSKKLDHIILPASPTYPAPEGYEKIECRRAHEVDSWSARLRAQEKRVYDMTTEERFNFEEPIRKHMMEELRKDLARATSGRAREFIAQSIRRIEEKREQRRKEVIETRMACEASEGVAP